MKFGMLLSGIGYLLFVLGGFAIGGLFFYGIYYTIFENVGQGLMLIGASVIGTFIVRVASGLLMAGGSAIGAKAVERELNNSSDQ